jgi:hypothetical protein
MKRVYGEEEVEDVKSKKPPLNKVSVVYKVKHLPQQESHKHIVTNIRVFKKRTSAFKVYERYITEIIENTMQDLSNWKNSQNEDSLSEEDESNFTTVLKSLDVNGFWNDSEEVVSTYHVLETLIYSLQKKFPNNSIFFPDEVFILDCDIS